MSSQLEKAFTNKIQETTDNFILFNMKPVRVNKESQKLMRDFKIAEIAINFIKIKVDRQTNNSKIYTSLIKQCYRFLVAYVRKNYENQLRVYDDLDTFMSNFNTYQVATLLVYEIFRDNKKFLTLNVTKFLRQIVGYSEE